MSSNSGRGSGADFDVDGQQVGARLAEPLHIAARLGNHQMDVQRQAGRAADGLDHGNPEAEIGTKWPSMMSKWSSFAPARSTRRISSVAPRSRRPAATAPPSATPRANQQGSANWTYRKRQNACWESNSRRLGRMSRRKSFVRRVSSLSFHLQALNCTSRGRLRLRLFGGAAQVVVSAVVTLSGTP